MGIRMAIRIRITIKTTITSRPTVVEKCGRHSQTEECEGHLETQKIIIIIIIVKN
jgi:hypothetical protein